MPTGQFYGSPDTAERSLTGPGQASQPKTLASQAMGTPQSGSNQYGFPIGPSAVSPRPLQASDYSTNTAGQFSLNSSQRLAPNPLFGPQQIVNSIYGPQQQILQDQLARQQAQLGMIGVDADYRSGALNRDNALARQALGLDRQALGVERGLIGGQQQNLGKLKDILKKQYGLTDRTLAVTLKQLGIDEASLRDMSKRKTFDLRSDLTARGAFNTVANERGTGRINRDLMYGLGGIGNQRTQAQIQYEGNRLGLDEKGIGYDNQALGLNARLANIGLDSQRLGISEQQLANSLQDGLYQIGLGSQVSINNLLDAMGGTNAQQAQLAGTILSEVANYANLPPEILRQIQQALGGASGTRRTQSPTRRTSGAQ